MIALAASILSAAMTAHSVQQHNALSAAVWGVSAGLWLARLIEHIQEARS